MSIADNSTRNKKVIYSFVAMIAIGLAVVFFYRQETPQVSKAESLKNTDIIASHEFAHSVKQFKVLHIMSYHSPWKWTDDQLQGFKGALSDLDITYKVFQMDTKQHSSEQWKLKVAAQAKELIDTWKPDLVFTSDDDAQQYIAKDYVNTSVPFVFCAVNADPENYGFAGSKNITGVLERMHFVQTIQLLKQLVPNVQKVAIITDTGKMWGPMIDRFKRKEERLDGVQIVKYEIAETFEQYKKIVKSYEGKVDALGMMGVFEFKDENGANVPLEQVQQWTIENSSLPDFSFWADRVDKGTLCAVTVSGTAQGRAAGKIARDILLGENDPGNYPIKATERGIPVINLARAKKLNINPKSSVLLTAEVVTEIFR